MSAKSMKTARGFSLLELGVVLAVSASVAAALLPAARQTRASAMSQMSAGNLRQIGAGAAQYAGDNRARIFTYTWSTGQSVTAIRFELPGGDKAVARSESDAAGVQNAEILRRRTGRKYGDHAIQALKGQIAHKRMIGLVLSDFLDREFPDPMFIDPADANQLRWAAEPFEWGPGSSVPYADIPIDAEDRSTAVWAHPTVRQRWAFTSSYQVTQYAWHADGSRRSDSYYHPIEETPHLIVHHRPEPMGQSGRRSQGAELSRGRRITQVRSPSLKVYFFEEFDYEQEGSPYFAYDHARPEKLMFDGSVNNWPSGDAGDSYSPTDPKAVWKQAYIPLDTFPEPLGGLGDDTPLNMRYRWTKGGLGGVDYTGSRTSEQDP